MNISYARSSRINDGLMIGKVLPLFQQCLESASKGLRVTRTP